MCPSIYISFFVSIFYYTFRHLKRRFSKKIMFYQYRNDSNPLKNTATPPPSQGQFSMFDGPVAANEALGGGMFGGSGF
jgi:hypothetical protein